MFNRSIFMAVTLLMVSSVSAGVVTIESVDQYNELNKGTLITMFTASWCGPCKQVKPHYIALSEEFPDVSFCMIYLEEDTDDSIKAIDTRVKGYPTFVFSHQGVELERVTGGLPKHKLKQFIAKNRATALGAVYQEEAPKFLSADEYYKKGLEDGKHLVEGCQRKDVAAGELMSLIVQDEAMTILLEASMKPDASTELFELYKAYTRGMKKALHAYKPHQLLQDSVITYSINLANYSLAAPDYAAVMKWQMDIVAKFQARLPELMWPIMAEESSK